MFTLRDVLTAREAVHIDVAFFGAEPDFLDEFRERFGNLGFIFREELGLSQEEAKKLPLTTKLGPKASAQFANFKEWLETKDEHLDLQNR